MTCQGSVLTPSAGRNPEAIPCIAQGFSKRLCVPHIGGSRRAWLSQWQILDLPGPLARETAFSKQDNLLDCNADRHFEGHLKHTGHRQAVGDSFIGESRNCVRVVSRSEEHTSELQSLRHLVCRLLLEKKNR